MQKLIDSIISNKQAIICEHHTFTRSAVLYTGIIANGLSFIACLHNNLYTGAVLTITMLIVCSIEFYFGKSYYILKFPKTSSANALYKVKDVYFIGSSIEEAHLFANLHGAGALEVEQVPEAQAYKFD